METSVLLAKLFGLIYLVAGIGMLRNPGRYRSLVDDMMRNGPFLYLGGVMALAAGFVVVTFHNVWTKDWTALITLIGWLTLAKGVVLLVAPERIGTLARFWTDRMRLAGFVVAGLGAILGYFGFLA